MKKIIFKNLDNSIGILTPTAEALESHTYQEIALKDVPEGLPYIIVDETIIPTDRTFRNAWTLPEDTEFEGVGATSNEFGVENDTN